MGQGTARNQIVDVAKGLAIVLMVAGHHLPADSPAWWVTLHDLIYTFHMPVFFFAAGYVWHMRADETYGGYIRRKAHRLLVPYVGIAGLYLTIKLLAGCLIPLDHPVTQVTALNAFLDPLHSFAPFLWFLYALFAVYAVGPLLGGKAMAPSVILAIGIYFFCDSYYVTATTAGYGFFVAGQIVRIRGCLDRPTAFPRIWIPIWVIFVTTALVWPKGHGWSSHARHLLVGSLGLTATYLFARTIVGNSSAMVRGLSRLGTFCMAIYLFHNLFAGGMKTILYRLPTLQGLPFLVQVAFVVVAGVLLPVLLEELVLRRSAILSALFLGKPWPTDLDAQVAQVATLPNLRIAQAPASHQSSMGGAAR